MLEHIEAARERTVAPECLLFAFGSGAVEILHDDALEGTALIHDHLHSAKPQQDPAFALVILITDHHRKITLRSQHGAGPFHDDTNLSMKDSTVGALERSAS